MNSTDETFEAVEEKATASGGSRVGWFSLKKNGRFDEKNRKTEG